MKLLKLVVVAAIGALLAGCAATATPETAALPETARTFTAAELHDYLSGYTEIWPSGNGGAYYAEDGSFEAVWKGDQVEGMWTVSDDGVLCWHTEEWGEAGSSDNPCDTYWLDGETITIVSGGEKYPEHERYEGNVVADLM